MDAARDDDDHLALAEDLVALGITGSTALEVQLSFELLITIQVLQRIGAADFERDERVVVCRLAKLAKADAIGRAGHPPHVLDDLVPPCQLVVAADPETEV